MIQISVTLFLSLASLPRPFPPAQTPMICVQPAKEAIRVYPTPNRQGSLTVSCKAKQALSFYLFDVEGKLVYQNLFSQNEEETVAGLSAGTYVYQAFQNDEEIKGGRVELKN